jgi:uncharacterized membrane protein
VTAQTLTTTRAVMRWIMAAFFLLAGIGHFVVLDKVVAIVPAWVPFPREVVIVTGILEMAGAIALLTQRWRRIAGAALALYAVCVFPANIKHAIDGIALLPFEETWWYHGPRLALQPVIVWWALFCSGWIDWPVRVRGM